MSKKLKLLCITGCDPVCQVLLLHLTQQSCTKSVLVSFAMLLLVLPREKSIHSECDAVVEVLSKTTLWTKNIEINPLSPQIFNPSCLHIQI